MYEIKCPRTGKLRTTTDNPNTVLGAMLLGWKVEKQKESEGNGRSQGVDCKSDSPPNSLYTKTS